jgi:hypothetical protein
MYGPSKSSSSALGTAVAANINTRDTVPISQFFPDSSASDDGDGDGDGGGGGDGEKHHGDEAATTPLQAANNAKVAAASRPPMLGDDLAAAQAREPDRPRRQMTSIAAYQPRPLPRTVAARAADIRFKFTKRIVRGLLAALAIMYLSLASRTVQAMWCRRATVFGADNAGTAGAGPSSSSSSPSSAKTIWVLTTDPTFECFVGQHVPVFVIALLILLLVIIAIPVGVFVHVLRRRDRIEDEAFCRKFGYFYEVLRNPFRDTYFVFVGFALALGLAIVRVGLAGRALETMLSVGALLIAYIAVVAVRRPFLRVWKNVVTALAAGVSLSGAVLNYLVAVTPVVVVVTTSDGGTGTDAGSTGTGAGTTTTKTTETSSLIAAVSIIVMILSAVTLAVLVGALLYEINVALRRYRKRREIIDNLLSQTALEKGTEMLLGGNERFVDQARRWATLREAIRATRFDTATTTTTTTTTLVLPASSAGSSPRGSPRTRSPRHSPSASPRSGGGGPSNAERREKSATPSSAVDNVKDFDDLSDDTAGDGGAAAAPTAATISTVTPKSHGSLPVITKTDVSSPSAVHTPGAQSSSVSIAIPGSWKQGSTTPATSLHSSTTVSGPASVAGTGAGKPTGAGRVGETASAAGPGKINGRGTRRGSSGKASSGKSNVTPGMGMSARFARLSRSRPTSPSQVSPPSSPTSTTPSIATPNGFSGPRRKKPSVATLHSIGHHRVAPSSQPWRLGASDAWSDLHSSNAGDATPHASPHATPLGSPMPSDDASSDGDGRTAIRHAMRYDSGAPIPEESGEVTEAESGFDSGALLPGAAEPTLSDQAAKATLLPTKSAPMLPSYARRPWDSTTTSRTAARPVARPHHHPAKATRRRGVVDDDESASPATYEPGPAIAAMRNSKSSSNIAGTNRLPVRITRTSTNDGVVKAMTAMSADQADNVARDNNKPPPASRMKHSASDDQISAILAPATTSSTSAAGPGQKQQPGQASRLKRSASDEDVPSNRGHALLRQKGHSQPTLPRHGRRLVKFATPSSFVEDESLAPAPSKNPLRIAIIARRLHKRQSRSQPTSPNL